MPTYRIDFTKNEVYECGASLIALLAYPKDDDTDTQRSELHRALCYLALRACAENHERWANSPQLIKPCYALTPKSDVNKALRSLERRLRDRIFAGHMAMPFFERASTGRPPRLPKGVKRLSINQLSAFVLHQTGQSEPENVESRIWRPSLPVIHLAAAVQVVGQILERDGLRAPHIGHLITNRILIEAIVRVAEVYEALIPKIARLSIGPDLLVRVRLVGK